MSHAPGDVAPGGGQSVHDVSVGVFGASKEDIPDEPSLFDDEETGW